MYPVTDHTLGKLGGLGRLCNPSVAGGLMVAAILWKLEDMAIWLQWSFLERVIWLMALIGLGAVVYLITLLILGVRLKDLKAATE